MTASITVDRSFHGPPDSGNGGYTAGLFAKALEREYGWSGPIEVTLRKPPPLDRAMDVVADASTAELRWREHVIATGKPAELTAPKTPAVGWEEALAAQASYDGFTEHPFAGCFTCGPDRSADDALRLFPGHVSDGVVAAAWDVQPWAAEQPELCWAALDCPTGWAIGLIGRPAVLGRMTAVVARPPHAGEHCVVVGRRLSVAGRKAFAEGVLLGADGTALAVASTTWIEVDPTAIKPPS